MGEVTVHVPEELVAHLSESALAKHVPERDRVRVAAVIYLFVTREVSLGRAAELSGIAYVDFMDVLNALGIPAITYDLEAYEQDRKATEELRARLARDRSR